jgi:hypothetical protein
VVIPPDRELAISGPLDGCAIVLKLFRSNSPEQLQLGWDVGASLRAIQC